ncbi:hypothetical protein V6N13_105189 [Hibiscus sabdariffa]
MQRLAHVVRPHDFLATVPCPTLRFSWIVTVGFAACPIAWLFIDEWLLGAVPVAVAGTSFSCCSSSHLTWRVSHPLVPWSTCPCSTTVLIASFVRGNDLMARPFCWPTLGLGFAACPIAWLLVVELLLGATPVVAAGTSFSCCSSFHPPWRASLLLVLWFTCSRSTTGLPVGSVCGTDLTARPFRWPTFGVGFAACPVAWLLVVERLLGVTPVVTADTSFSCCSSFHPPWRVSLLLVLWFTCPSTTGLLAGSVCGVVLTARPHRWPVLGVGFAACPAVWLLVLEWFGFPAQPHYWLLTYASRLRFPWHTSPPVHPDSTRANASALDPAVPVVAAHAARTPLAPVAASVADNPHDSSVPSETADSVEEAVDDASLESDASEPAAVRSTPDDAPYDPMVHTETSDMLEEALEISRDCVLLADLTGVIQANGEDLVNEAIIAAADSIIRESGPRIAPIRE